MVADSCICRASLEFLRLVAPPEGCGKAIIDRCLTNEEILLTSVLEVLPDEHKPDDAYIAAKLKVNNAFRNRLAASFQRKWKRNANSGNGAEYQVSDEVWCHFKPTEEELNSWIEEGSKADERVDEAHAVRGDGVASHDRAANDVHSDDEINGVRGESSSPLEHKSNAKRDVAEDTHDRPKQSWLGLHSALKDGPQQG